jgi:trehalose-6-phosphate synthase
MSRLILVSNRLPVSVVKGRRGLRFERSVGGLATGLGHLSKSYDSIWIGWPGIAQRWLGVMILGVGNSNSTIKWKEI